jgi:hypothetical protein
VSEYENPAPTGESRKMMLLTCVQQRGTNEKLHCRHGEQGKDDAIYYITFVHESGLYTSLGNPSASSPLSSKLRGPENILQNYLVFNELLRTCLLLSLCFFHVG